MNLEKILIEFGLTPKETQVYLATLKLGPSSAYKISQKIGIPRSTCYEVLENLLRLGIVTTFLRKKVRYFSVEEPAKIVQLAKERARALESAFPQLQALYGEARYQPNVRFYQGKVGMNLVLEEILKEATELLSFSSAEDLFRVLDDEFPKFIERRIKKKIPVRAILRKSSKAEERLRLGLQELRRVRIVSADYIFHGLTFIWGRKIAMFSFQKDIFAVVIDSKELADIQRAMFEIIWNSLEPSTNIRLQ